MSGLTPSEHSFRSWDGTELFYRAWRPPGATDKALILFHRGHEHSGRLQELVDLLDLDDVAIFAWDARGHGRSPGERGYAPSFGCLVKDADSFARAVNHEHGIPLEQTAVMAHSVGGVIAAAWVHDYAPPIRALVLGCPAFRVKLYMPFAVLCQGTSFSFGRPCLRTGLMLSTLFDARPALVSAAVVLSTVVSVVTLTLLLAVLTMGS